MKVLVTGGTGLVGAFTIARLLQSGHDVRALVRDRTKLASCLAPLGSSAAAVEQVMGDVTAADSVAGAVEGCDALIHCAGVFSDRLRDEALLQRVNVEGTRIVLAQAVAAQLDPIIHVSSYLALFPPAGQVQEADDPVTEPRSMYARTKAAAERIARDHQARGTPVVTVYPGSIQGPHDPTFSIGSQIIARTLRDRRMLVCDSGRSYVDVRDVADLLNNLLEAGRGPRRLMCGGHYLLDEEVRQLLSRVSGEEIRALRIPGWLLRGMGRGADVIARLRGRPFTLTAEAADVLTRSVPCNDAPGLEDPGYRRLSAEQSFRDLVSWILQSGKIETLP